LGRIEDSGEKKREGGREKRVNSFYGIPCRCHKEGGKGIGEKVKRGSEKKGR